METFATKQDVKTDAGLKELNLFLEKKSYLTGYTPSKLDAEFFAQIAAAPAPKHPHAARWWHHIASFSAQERAAFPGAGIVAEAPAAAEAPKGEEEDEFDVFGEETAEEKTLKEELLKKQREKEKNKPAAKSQVIMDVKPWDDTTPMDKMEEEVRAIEMEGLTWGTGKLVPVGYGIRKLTIVAVVVDDLVSMDDVEERITSLSDYVQSVDIVSFNKL